MGKIRVFHPLHDVPTTVEEVKIAFACGRDEWLSATLFNLFTVHMAMGKTLFQAYERTILSSIEKTADACLPGGEDPIFPV